MVRQVRRVVVWLTYLAAIVVYLAWETAHRGVYAYSTTIYNVSDADEWRYTACSRLVAHGYQLFSQVFSAQPPVFFLTLAGSMRLFGESITGARAAEIVCGLVCIAAVGFISSELVGMEAGALASLVLALSPGFLIYSHAIEAEGPMMALSTVCLALVLYSLRSDRWPLLMVAGVTLAAAVEIKLFAAEAVLPALWLIFRLGQNWRLRGRDGLIMAISAAIPVGALFVAFHPAEQWDQVITMHSRAASAILPDVTPAVTQFKDFLLLDPGLSALALLGLLSMLLLKRWTESGFLFLWLGGSALMLAVFHPLFPHHFAILLAPLAVCAGATTVWLQASVRWLSVRFAGIPALGAAIYLATFPRLAHADRHILLPPSLAQAQALSQFVDRRTSTHSLIAADDLEIADLANRLVSPPLCDPSNVRLHSGYLSAATLIAATRTYHVALVLPTLGIYQQVPDYMSWLTLHYHRIPAPGGNSAYMSPVVRDGQKR